MSRRVRQAGFFLGETPGRVELELFIAQDRHFRAVALQNHLDLDNWFPEDVLLLACDKDGELEASKLLERAQNRVTWSWQQAQKRAKEARKAKNAGQS